MDSFTTFKKPSEYNQGDIFEVEFIESQKKEKQLFITTDREAELSLCRINDGKMVHRYAALFGDSNRCNNIKNTTLKRKGK